MRTVTWLHLSDWHQKGPDFDRVIVRDALIKDLRERERIDPSLAVLDFVVFSGDLAFSGAAAEYQAAQQQLLDPVLAAVGLPRNRLFMVPGNHDLKREHIGEMLPTGLQTPLESDAMVQKWLNEERVERTLEPFTAYTKFVTEYTGQTSPHYGSVQHLDARGTKVGLLGVNSAWMTGRNKDAKGEVQDYGYTLIGEPQIVDALKQIADDELRIAVMHHPFDWLSQFDRNRTEARLSRACHFILCGHVHDAQVRVIQGTTGNAVIIPAGASYERRVAADSRYTNAYNWVHLDLEAGHGVVYLRRWSDKRDEWIEDRDTYTDGKFKLTDLPKDLHKEKIDTNVVQTAVPSASDFSRQRMVLEGYLNALIRNNTDLEPGGIKQTKVRVVLPLDSIYVGLQADRDRPDVDRRVMQEELDEIKKNLEREEDPKERERQYQIWALHSRIIQEALEISGPREDLSTIVQQHRQVVILGDPGSGKTTLVRYLTLCLARAVLADLERLFEPQELWDERKVWRLPDLGPVRLPILLRISHYAEARQKDPDLALVDYLPRYFAGLSVPHGDELGKLLQQLLDQGRCMILLDGLDEIIDPTDRRNIAAAIGQFASVYRETGLPDWLAQQLSHVPARKKGRVEVQSLANNQQEEIDIQWVKDMPEDVRVKWEQQIKQRRQEFRRGRAVRLAWELLDESRYAHVGNRFVVTSRIAGYHFAGVPGEFEHFTIRRMNLEDIQLFLKKWCPAVERRMAESPDATQVEQRAQREIQGILKAVNTTPGVRRMAENPLLLRILAIIHRNEAHLPQRRVELYETACVTLLRDWHLERGTPKGAQIDDVKATSLLGPLALYIHENRASGFLSKGETERILGTILARERGEKNLDQPSLETREAVQTFLETVREHSGLFVERGEGLYGFMHLTFEEYFTARQLVSSATRARGQILDRLHQPRWREPILLAVGSLSKQFYDDTQEILRAILEASSPYEGVLHRDLLFAADCIGDSVNVAPVLRQEIAEKLLSLYCDRRGSGRFRLQHQQLKDALLTLCNDQGDVAVESALAERLRSCKEGTSFECALDVVDWLKARTPIVAEALAAHPCLDELPHAQELLRAVQSRLLVNGNGAGVYASGWDAVQQDIGLARLFGALWHYDWSTLIGQSLDINKEAQQRVHEELQLLSSREAVELGQQLMQQLTETPSEKRNPAFWNSILDLVDSIRRKPPADTPLKSVATELALAIVESPEYLTDTRQVKRYSGDYMRFPLQTKSDVTSVLSIEEASIKLSNVVRGTTAQLANLNFDEVFRSAGLHLLRSASAGQTLIPIFTARARLFEPFPVPFDEEIAFDRTKATQMEIIRDLLSALKSPASGQQYQEAIRLLASSPYNPFASSIPVGLLKSLKSPNKDRIPRSERNRAIDELRQSIADVVRADLASPDVARSTMALQAFTSPRVREYIHFDETILNSLFERLEGSIPQARLALEVLLSRGLSARLLSWCFSALRQQNNPLQDIITERLNGLGPITGEADVLALIDEALRDDSLRPIALELMRKISWTATDTFVQALIWLKSEDSMVRHLAALLFIDQTDLLHASRSLLAGEQATEGPEEHPWRRVREKKEIIRLLSGLWQNGWRDGLINFFTGGAPRTYISQLAALRSSNNNPNHEEDILHLLDTAQGGEALISIFETTAARLIELEGVSPDGPPRTEYIDKLRVELLAQIQEALGDKDASFAVRVELIRFLAATQNENILFTLYRDPDGGSDQSWPEWLSARFTELGFESNPTIPDLARLLAAPDSNVRTAAAIALILSDLPLLVVETLLETVHSPDDRIRMKGRQGLISMGNNLASDGRTHANVYLLEKFLEADEHADGLLLHVLFNALINIRHEQPYWVTRWLNANTQGQEPDEVSIRGINYIGEASQEVLSRVCSVLNDSSRSTKIRYAVAFMISNMLRTNEHTRSDQTLIDPLIIALNESDLEIRRFAAYGLQWASGRAAWPAATALERIALTDSDLRTRVLAIRSLGRTLHRARGFRDLDVSKEALFRWMQTETRSQLSIRRNETGAAVKLLPRLFTAEEAPDAETILTKLEEPQDLRLPDDLAPLATSSKWKTLIERAKQEWEVRRYWLAKLPFIPESITRVQTLLADNDPIIRRAAARALACVYHGDEDRPTRLRELLANDSEVLRAMLDGAVNDDSWIEGSTADSLHGWDLKQIAGWVEAKVPEERFQFVDSIMNHLEQALEPEPDDAEPPLEGYRGWPARRILMGVLAELSERLTYRIFTHTRDLANVVELFARAAKDGESYDVRRFAVRALGNLQQFTEQVADIFFGACQDLSTVYVETRTAVTKFKVFDAGSLERLTAAVRDPSVTVAYHAALLLGELGVSRSEDLGPEGRKRVADELVQLLDAPGSARVVYDFSENINGNKVGFLYDIIYEALVRVVAGPDAPREQINYEPNLPWQSLQ